MHLRWYAIQVKNVNDILRIFVSTFFGASNGLLWASKPKNINLVIMNNKSKANKDYNKHMHHIQNHYKPKHGKKITQANLPSISSHYPCNPPDRKCKAAQMSHSNLQGN